MDFSLHPSGTPLYEMTLADIPVEGVGFFNASPVDGFYKDCYIIASTPDDRISRCWEFKKLWDRTRATHAWHTWPSSELDYCLQRHYPVLSREEVADMIRAVSPVPDYLGLPEGL